MKWDSEYRVHYYYTDFGGVLKPSYIGRYMHESANDALKNLGPKPEYLQENNLAFILSKISFRFYEEIHEDAQIKVSTWALPPKTAIFPRNYRVETNGRVAAEATSAWALCNTKEKSILRPDTLPYEAVRYDDEVLSFEVPRRINPPIELSFLYDYTVQYSDIDSNLHMNNAVYIDRVCECIYANEAKIGLGIKKCVCSIDISYNNEILFKETMEVSGVCVPDEENPSVVSLYIKAKNKSTNQNIFDAKAVYTI